MIVHNDNQEIEVRLKEGVSLYARCSHIESQDGKHLFVVAVADQTGRDKLVAARNSFPAALKTTFKIKANTDLEYIERHPSGSLYRVNLDNIGQGPGSKGEPGYMKPEALLIPEEPVKARLGDVKMPTVDTAPRYAEASADPNQSGLPRLGGKERNGVRQEAKRIQKPRL